MEASSRERVASPASGHDSSDEDDECSGGASGRYHLRKRSAMPPCPSLPRDAEPASMSLSTGTSVELRPVVSLDRPGKHSTWPVGRITTALHEAFRASTRAHA